MPGVSFSRALHVVHNLRKRRRLVSQRDTFAAKHFSHLINDPTPVVTSVEPTIETCQLAELHPTASFGVLERGVVRSQETNEDPFSLSCA
jgi:hypothetical protein